MSDSYTKLFSSSILCRRLYAGARWVKFNDPSCGRLPPEPCCYCVFDSDRRVIYIGQTNNLRERMAYHVKLRKFPLGFSLKARFGERYGDWAMRELRLIRRLQPPMNARVV